MVKFSVTYYIWEYLNKAQLPAGIQGDKGFSGNTALDI